MNQPVDCFALHPPGERAGGEWLLVHDGDRVARWP